MVMNCYYHFDQSFIGPSQFQNQQSYVQNHFQGVGGQMITMYTTPKVVSDTNWDPDSRASNHVTSDATNLMTKTEYYGLDQVYIGNGMGLSIKHVGQTVFSSPYTSKILSLKQLFHVPTITKKFT